MRLVNRPILDYEKMSKREKIVVLHHFSHPPQRVEGCNIVNLDCDTCPVSRACNTNRGIEMQKTAKTALKILIFDEKP